jgi:catechol 2,3-dioxygenase-like lactoylglutathione lyase family enzyme
MDMTERSKTGDAGATAPPIGRIVETAIYVDDLPRAQAFYVEILGARILLESGRLVALDLHGESVLLLFERGATSTPLETPGGTVPPHGATGVQHLAFAIDSADLEAWVAYLENSGIAIESRVKWPRGGESLYLRDPEGHSVELITPGLWATY